MKLNKLRVGDAFRYGAYPYIAIALTPDPFDVFCLNTVTKELEEIEETEEVELIENWYVAEMHQQEKSPRGKKLEVLY